jgi:hypothetical protein
MAVEPKTELLFVTNLQGQKLELADLTLNELEPLRDELVERLDIGYVKTEDARQAGQDVSKWEDYWIELLRAYEAVVDKICERKGRFGL